MFTKAVLAVAYLGSVHGRLSNEAKQVKLKLWKNSSSEQPDIDLN
jgi:hypothetical protein